LIDVTFKGVALQVSADIDAQAVLFVGALRSFFDLGVAIGIELQEFLGLGDDAKATCSALQGTGTSVGVRIRRSFSWSISPLPRRRPYRFRPQKAEVQTDPRAEKAKEVYAWESFPGLRTLGWEQAMETTEILERAKLASKAGRIRRSLTA